MGFTVAVLGRGRRARARQVFMELKIEKLFGEEFAGKPAPERGDVLRFTPRPISDCSVVFAVLPGVLRRRESAISFSEIRRDFFRIFSSFRPDDITFF